MLILFNLCQQWNNILREYGVTQNQTKKTLKNSTKIKAAQVICIKAKQNEVKQNTDGVSIPGRGLLLELDYIKRLS